MSSNAPRALLSRKVIYRRHPNDGFDVYEPCIEGCLRMDAPFHAYARWLKEKHPAFHARLSDRQRKVLHHPQEVHFTRWAAERTIHFLQNRDREKPFFAMMSLFDPHNPYEDYPLEMADLIDPAGISDPLIRENEFEGKPEDILREHHESYLGNFRNFSQEQLRKMRFGYHASLAFADQEIGRVLDVLERKGLADNTLVVFTSDHGDMLGDHSLLVKGAFFYDPNTRVPLLMRWPKQIPAGTRAEGLVQLHDLAATVLSAAGAPGQDLGAMPDSRNLLPLACGETDRVRDLAVCCYRNSGLTRGGYWDPPIHAAMFRDERFKLNVWHDAAGTGRGLQGEFYDMQADPQELDNRWNSPSHASFRAALTERALEWFAAQERGRGSRGGETRPAKRMQNTLKQA